MSILNNMGISKRLGFGYGLICAMVALMAVIGFTRMASISEQVELIVHYNNVKIRLVHDMRNSLDDVYIRLGKLLTARDQQAREKYLGDIKKARDGYSEPYGQLQKMEKNEHGKKLLAAYRDVIDKARGVNAKVIDLAMGGKVARR